MKIVAVKPLDLFRLHLRFDDGVSDVADLSPLAGRGVFQIWSHAGTFERVVITPFGALEWPGEIDLRSDALYLQTTGKAPEKIFPALSHPLSQA